MTKLRPLTLSDLPLYASDEDIGEAVLGHERRSEFAGMARLRERDGMPKVSTYWGGRYVPAVKRFLDIEHGLGGEAQMPLAPDGKEGKWQARRSRSKRST